MKALRSCAAAFWLASASAALGCGSDGSDTAGSGGAALGGSGGSGATSDASADAIAGSGGSAAAAGSGGVAGAGGSAGSAGAGGGLIVVDPKSSSWLGYAGGGTHFLCGAGDPEGFLYRGVRNSDGTRSGDQQQLIEKLAPTGANGIYLMAVRSHGGDGAADENPFVDSDPKKGLDQDILSQWESWFTALDAAGVVVYFFVYDDSASVWSTGDSVGAEEKAFLEALVDRFEHHDHWVWVVAEEYSEKLSKARVSAIAATIRAADAKQHVIGVHQLDGLAFDFAGDPNIDQFTIQYNVPTAGALHAGMTQAFQTAKGAYNLNMSEAAGYGTGAMARKKSWATAMGGAYVMVLGMDIASTAVSDLEDCGRLRKFMESTRLSEMSPHDELALGGTEYVLAKPGELYIAYASALSGDMGVKGMSAGTWSLSFLDAVTGQSSQEQQTLTAGDHTFSKPSGFGSEVALYLEKS